MIQMKRVSTKTKLIASSVFLFVIVWTGLLNAAETYSNPVISKLGLADPTIIRYDGKYYMYPTGDSRSYDVYISDDLVSWTKGRKVFTTKEKNVWAPDVFYNKSDSKFYLYYSANWKIGAAEANRPDEVFVNKGVLINKGIDAHMFQDDDGKYYLYYSKESKVYVQEMKDPLHLADSNDRSLIEPTEAWEYTPVATAEGPWMIKHEGIYYLLYSGSPAYSKNYAVGYASSSSPLGPFTKYQGNPIIKWSEADGIYGPGHGSVTTDSRGNLWHVYHQKKGPADGWDRFICIDPMWFDANGVLHSKATRTPQDAPVITGQMTSLQTQTVPSAAGTDRQSMRIIAQDQKLIVKSRNFTAEFTGASLTSLTDIKNGTEFCRQDSVFPLELFFVDKDVLKEDKQQKVEVKLLSDFAARIIITGARADRELFVRLDPATGDLCVTPSGRSLRRQGLLSVRWNIPFVREAALVLPCVNGMFVESGRDFPGNDRFVWPYRWNAQLVIAQRDGCCLMIHSEDTAFKFKALNLARNEGLTTLGFESERVGPVWDNSTAGAVQWRLNTYDGDWKVPAERYRGWMNDTYKLKEKRSSRPKWVDDISFTVQWAGPDVNVLNALAKIYPPEKTLIHLASWRTSNYDINYPDYTASNAAKAFTEKANAMGFKVMPHFNYFAIDIRQPVFQQLRDWQIRSVIGNELEGWYWPPETYNQTQMAYIHPGLGIWRRILIDSVRNACASMKAPAAFLDETLCTWNTDNGLVENMTTIEGLREMQEEFAGIQPDIVLAGEGLNEISFQRQCFAQAHIHDGWGELKEHHILAAHPICSFLWKGHTRLIGYHHLNPNDKSVEIGVEVYRRMGAIATLVCNDPKLINKDQPVVKKIIESAQASLQP